MRLGRKVTSRLAWFTGGLFALVLSAASLIVHLGFRNAEDVEARRHVDRVVYEIRSMAAELSIMATAWAERDDTIDFVGTGSSAYIAAHLTPRSFDLLKINGLVIADRAGRIVWSGAHIRNAPRLRPGSADLRDLPQRLNLRSGMWSRGVEIIDGRPMVVSVRRIGRRGRRDPPVGVLLMARALDQERLGSIAARMFTSVAVIPISPERARTVPVTLGQSDPVTIERTGANVIAGTYLRNTSGEPCAFVSIVLPRTFYHRAVWAVDALGIVLGLLALGFAAALSYSMRRLVVARIEDLANQVRKVGTNQDSTASIHVTGEDELAGLAADVESMRSRIMEARSASEAAQLQYNLLFEGIPSPSAIYEVVPDETGRVIDARYIAANAAFLAASGRSPEDIIGRSILGLSPEAAPPFMERLGMITRQRTPEQFEFLVPGTERCVNVVVFPTAPGVAAAIFTDITDIRAAESIRQADQERIRLLLRQQTAMNQLAAAVGVCQTLAEVYRTIHQQIRLLVDDWHFIIASYDAEQQRIRTVYAANGDDIYDAARFPALPLGSPDTDDQSRVIHTGEPCCAQDCRIRFQPGGPSHSDAADDHEGADDDLSLTRSVIYLPMKVQGRTVGILQVQSRTQNAFDANDVALLGGLASVAAVAIQSARLREDLTAELRTRTAAEERVGDLLRESDRARRSLLSALEDERRARQSLSESELRFRLAFDTAPYAILITRARDGKIVACNDGFSTLTGWSREEAIGRTTQDLGIWVRPEERDHLVRTVLRGGILTGQVYLFQRRDGRHLIGLTSSQRFEFQGDVCILSSVNDITPLRRAEELVALRLRLQEHSVHADLDELLRFALDEAERALDSRVSFFHFIESEERSVSLQAWSTRTAAEFCHVEGAQHHYPMEQAGVWADCVRERRVVVHNDFAAAPKRNTMPEGHAPLLREMLIPVISDRTIVAVLGLGNKPMPYTDEDIDIGMHIAQMTWEIASRKRAEIEREALREQLVQAGKMESIGQLAGGVAHDFNNMLMVMLGTCDLMDEHAEGHPEIRVQIERMRAAATRAQALTNKLLAFGRRQTMRLEAMDVNALVASLHEMLAPVIGQNIELHTHPYPEPLYIRADRSQLEQAIMNLAVNARDAMPQGGRLTIETAPVTLDDDYVRTHAETAAGEYALITVSDTGSGMPPEIRKRIFEPFFTTKSSGYGTGLGLPSVFGTVKQFGGSIDVYTEPGTGTTFRIVLPRTGEHPTESAAASRSAPEGQGQHVAVVEDDPALREVFGALITGLGYRVRLFVSGREAIAAVEAGDFLPDLLITDVVMPDMNGPTLVENMHRILPELPILMISGYTDTAMESHGFAERDVPLLSKPFSRDQIARAIADLIGSNGAPEMHPAATVPPDASGRARPGDEGLPHHDRDVLTLLIVDDDPTTAELYDLHARKRGHTVLGAVHVDEALERCSETVDVILLDLNLGVTTPEHALAELRRAGCRAPAILHSGYDLIEVTDALRGLGVIGALPKTGRFAETLNAIEAMVRANG
ncbi:MAG: GAF domain-containing protein [Chthonomonadales bacterium]|nr:GAF domain-containing protein [Chthonomonadales bacterium]